MSPLGVWLGVALAQSVALPDVDRAARGAGHAQDEAAVVIGMEHYAFVQSVDYATRDAVAFRDFLVRTRGLDAKKVQLLLSGSSEDIQAAIRRAGELVDSDGTVWVYYAGHGAASATDGARLLLADDVKRDPAVFERRAVRVDAIPGLVGGHQPRVIMVLDACYNGASRSGAALVKGLRFAVPVYAQAGPAHSAEWAAAAPDQLSGPFNPARHGIFTYFALGALRGWADGELDGHPDGVVTAVEAQAFTRRAVETVETGRTQTPQWQGEDARSWTLSEGVHEPAPDLPALAEGLANGTLVVPYETHDPLRVQTRASAGLGLAVDPIVGRQALDLQLSAAAVLVGWVGLGPSLTLDTEGRLRLWGDLLPHLFALRRGPVGVDWRVGYSPAVGVDAGWAAHAYADVYRRATHQLWVVLRPRYELRVPRGDDPFHEVSVQLAIRFGDS